jgi:hypothetical protein
VLKDSKSDPEVESQARLVLVRSLLTQKKPTESQTELVALNALVTSSSPRSLRFGALIAGARVQAALGQSNVGVALESLQKIAREAKKAGMPGFELEARLAIGEIELEIGKTLIARKELDDVQREASVKGFKLIEQRAAKATGS